MAEAHKIQSGSWSPSRPALRNIHRCAVVAGAGRRNQTTQAPAKCRLPVGHVDAPLERGQTRSNWQLAFCANHFLVGHGLRARRVFHFRAPQRGPNGLRAMECVEVRIREALVTRL